MLPTRRTRSDSRAVARWRPSTAEPTPASSGVLSAAAPASRVPDAPLHRFAKLAQEGFGLSLLFTHAEAAEEVEGLMQPI